MQKLAFVNMHLTTRMIIYHIGQMHFANGKKNLYIRHTSIFMVINVLRNMFNFFWKSKRTNNAHECIINNKLYERNCSQSGRWRINGDSPLSFYWFLQFAIQHKFKSSFYFYSKSNNAFPYAQWYMEKIRRKPVTMA